MSKYFEFAALFPILFVTILAFRLSFPHLAFSAKSSRTTSWKGKQRFFHKKTKILSKTNMAAINRTGFLASRLTSAFFQSSNNVRPLSSGPVWMASSKMTKSIDPSDIEQSGMERRNKMAGLITVEGAVDVGTTSVGFIVQRRVHLCIVELLIITGSP